MLIEAEARIEDLKDSLVARQCLPALELSFFAIEIPDEVTVGAASEGDGTVVGVGVHLRAEGRDFTREQDATGDGAPADLLRGCDDEAHVAGDASAAIDDGDAHVGTPVPGPDEARRHNEIRRPRFSV